MSEDFPIVTEVLGKLAEDFVFLTEVSPKVTEPIFKMTKPIELLSKRSLNLSEQTLSK
ncbi:hypothetical protein [Sutcliffiella horikoshii]|uniref:hypothetical protein n=1 Tax=Sutcliffiella horikoshii TaxID=79883 RepID=UPI001653A1FD|nr:hypothetical protein [Sutcliffiella horikoshii]